MANYFVIDSTFKPYSFDELIKPYQMYGEAYRQQEALLDAAREKEFAAEKLDENLDKEAYDMYTQATSGLRAASDELATRGLSSKLRGTIRNTARDYQTTMATLNAAQAELAAERIRRANLGPDYVFQQNDIRIGDYLGGKAANQTGASLKTIASDVAAEFSARAATISKDTWEKALLDGKQTGYFDIKTEKGLTDAQFSTIFSDQDTWNNIMKDPNISDNEKLKLQGFRDVITSKKQALGYDQYDSIQNKDAIADAIFRGAHAGLGSVTHEYKKDESYNPLGWSQLQLSRDRLDWEKERYNDAKDDAAAEAAAKARSGGSGNSTIYDLKTPHITVHANGQTRTYTSWDKVDQENTSKPILWGLFGGKNETRSLTPVAIEDITDTDIQRAMLNRINVPNANLSDSQVAMQVAEHLPALRQLTVQISGTPGSDDYVWSIEDKNVARMANGNIGDEETEGTDPNSKER